MDSREAFEAKFPPPNTIFWDEAAQQYEPRFSNGEEQAEQWHGMYLAWQAGLSQQEKSAEPVRKNKSGKVRRRMFSERELLAGLSQQESAEPAAVDGVGARTLLLDAVDLLNVKAGAIEQNSPFNQQITQFLDTAKIDTTPQPTVPEFTDAMAEAMEEVLRDHGFDIDYVGELDKKQLWCAAWQAALSHQPEDAAPRSVRTTALTCVYTAGYGMGHHDTVEGQYTDVHYADRETFFEETVKEWIADHPEYFSAPQPAAVPEESEEMDREAISMIVGAAIYDFASFLTFRDERLTCSAADNLSSMVDALQEFLTKRGINCNQELPILSWQEWISAPQPPKEGE